MLDGNAAPAEIDRLVRVADTLGESLHVLDAEAIAALEPDVIITQGICDVCAIREGDVRTIAESLRRLRSCSRSRRTRSTRCCTTSAAWAR